MPTVGGMLLFGPDRLAHFPDAWIQAGRFAGTDKARIQDHAEVKDHPVAAVENALAFINRHMAQGAEIGDLRREDRWTLPPVALREALMNAVVHADYSQRGAPIQIAMFDDRLEIENPGLLPVGLTIDDLKHGTSRLRNRVIGRVFHELGLIELWGSGVQRMIAACAEVGLAPPKLEEIGLRFRVTFYSESSDGLEPGPLDQAVLDCLGDGEGRTTAEIAKQIGRTTRATRTRLKSLVDRGLVRENGTGPRDPGRRYYLAES